MMSHIAILLTLFPTLSSLSMSGAYAFAKKAPHLEGPVKLSFLLTNDIHGHLEPKLTFLGSIASQLRAQPEYRAGEAGLIILDSGDQFQGTLLSNYDEGASVFKVLNEIGYDAVVPGNHDYDFGPLGWLYDRVSAGSTSEDPREVIRGLSRFANFPLLSANTFYKRSILSGGRSLPLDDQCRPSQQTPSIELDFERARQPDFLKPYLIVKKAGVRIALIGIDHHNTSSNTTRENVSDLCFRDEAVSYLALRRKLHGQADVFVLLMHNGNTDKAFDGSEITRRINAEIPNGVHLVAAGHTHYVHNSEVGGVRVIQSGANGKFYGRVDLIFDPSTGKVLSEKTVAAAGIPIDPVACDSARNAFVCQSLTLPIPSNPEIDQILLSATSAIAPIAKKKIATATTPIKVNRIDESALANLLTDILRKTSNAVVALMNTGGIRAPLPAGDILYENLFEVLPFQNQAVQIKELPWSRLKAALLSAIQTCGQYGTLAQSGLKIEFTRNCATAAGTIDPQARLIRVKTLSDEVLLDSDRNLEIPATTLFNVVTLDFIAAGGSGYPMFTGITPDTTLGIVRELIAERLTSEHPILSSEIDHRFLNLTP